MIAGGHSASDLCTDSDVNDMHGAQGFQSLGAGHRHPDSWPRVPQSPLWGSSFARSLSDINLASVIKRILSGATKRLCEVWIALFQYSDSAFSEIDLHDTAAEKIDTQNSIDMMLATAAQRAKVDRQDRFWKSYNTAYRLQIVHAISKALPIHALHYLPISERYAKTACCLEIDSANAGT